MAGRQMNTPVRENQTWSTATYIRMVVADINGMRFEPEGITFKPHLPEYINELNLTQIPYRKAMLNIHLKGSGSKIKSFLVNKKKIVSATIPSSVVGQQEIQIELVNK